MRRRSLLTSIATLAAGTGLVGVGKASGLSRELVHTPARGKPRTKQFIEAADGTNLFFRDWGTGRPVVFLAPWALDSDWWEYQMAFLAGQGLRCIGFDRRGHGQSTLASAQVIDDKEIGAQDQDSSLLSFRSRFATLHHLLCDT